MNALSLMKLKEIALCKCPVCGKSDVFTTGKKYFIPFPVMKEQCEHCKFKFNGEPGYFLGGMYISYGLAVLQGIAAFVILKYGINLTSIPLLVISVIVVILVLAPFNYKLSRVIWMNVFPKN